MRYNGKLYIQTLSGGGINEYGEPIASQYAWGPVIPCIIETISDTRKGRYEDGRFRQSSFNILFCSVCPITSIKRVRLERKGEVLGEFDVISVESFEGVGRVRITV